ncbi:hypothetical protein MPSEU_000230100 [Mayamaea pseudoterrestris]|nr:hypothetical protein MPSEU_000230100 [Mayamaea pseudoterrestris]
MPVQTRRSMQKPAVNEHDDKSPQEISRPTRQSQAAEASTSNKRTNDKSTAAVITTKKSKTTDDALETSLSYNLRSSARKPSRTDAATVTPATMATNPRRLTPFATPPFASHHARADSMTFDSSSSYSKLPPGVIDIYDPLQPCVSTHRTCNCPSDRCLELGTDVAFAHIAHYGEDFGEIIKEREQMEHARHLSRIPQVRFDNDNDEDEDKENNSGRSDCNKTDEDSKSSSSSSSSRYTPPANARTQVYPRGLELNSFHANGSEAEAARSLSLPRQPELNTTMRQMLVNWMVEVCLEYKVSDDALHLAVTLVDRVLLLGPTEDELEDWDGDILYDRPTEFFYVPKALFQALGCACILIASKLEDRSTPKMEDLCYISDYSVSEPKLREIEEDVCRLLSFRLSPVTPQHFVNEFLRASHACPSRSCQYDHPILRSVVAYILALSRLSYALSLLKPSLLTAASVYLARATLGIREEDPDKRCQPSNPFWTKTLQHYTGYSIAEIKPIVLVLHKLQSAAEFVENEKGVFAAYRSSARHLASLKIAVPMESLGFGRGHQEMLIEDLF